MLGQLARAAVLGVPVAAVPGIAAPPAGGDLHVSVTCPAVPAAEARACPQAPAAPVCPPPPESPQGTSKAEVAESPGRQDLSPDGNMYLGDFSDAVAVRCLGPNNEVPERVPRNLIYDFDQPPSAETLRKRMQEGAYAAGLEDQRRGYGIAVWGAGGAAGAASAAGAKPAAAQAGGAGRVAAGAPAYVPAQPPAPGAPGEGEDGGPGPAALQGHACVSRDVRPPAGPTVRPVTVDTVRWVAAASVVYPGGSVDRGDDEAISGSEMVSGRKGVIVLMGVSVLMGDVGDGDVEVYRSREAHHDARLLKMQRDSRGDGHRPWRDVTRGVSEVKQTDWPSSGPQTAEWCTRFLDRRSEGPVGWSRRWRADSRLAMDQWAVSEHETLAKAIERLGTPDQYDVVNVAAAEYIERRMRLIECFYYEVCWQADGSKHQDRKGGKGVRLEEMADLSGKPREDGEVMVAPELLSYFATELERDSGIRKQMREAREGRRLAGKHDQ
ncbi:unnamed protein product [Prorocentrum cordatum]|uniref:Uncharacterized protein n=1 Tax=Prorocentrum cordatum TaxID=2364126 RepID=A0ABN9VGM4_9DINO|nr:unnamed protein product [Polarella glacialis]